MYSLSFVGEAFVLSLSIFMQPSSLELLFFLSLFILSSSLKWHFFLLYLFCMIFVAKKLACIYSSLSSVILFNLFHLFLSPGDWYSSTCSGSANPSLLASFSRNQPASFIASFSFSNSMQLALLSENGIELHLCSCPFSCDMTVSLLTRQGQPTPLHRFILVHLSRSLFHCVSIVLFSFLSVASSSCAIPTNASRCRIWFYSVCVRYPGTSLPSTSRSAYRPSFALPLDRM